MTHYIIKQDVKHFLPFEINDVVSHSDLAKAISESGQGITKEKAEEMLAFYLSCTPFFEVFTGKESVATKNISTNEIFVAPKVQTENSINNLDDKQNNDLIEIKVVLPEEAIEHQHINYDHNITDNTNYTHNIETENIKKKIKK